MAWRTDEAQRRRILAADDLRDGVAGGAGGPTAIKQGNLNDQVFTIVEGVANLSTFRNPGFAEAYGVKLASGPLAGLTARAVVVLDENDQVLHSELVAEIADEPNYDAALAEFEVARNTLFRSRWAQATTAEQKLIIAMASLSDGDVKRKEVAEAMGVTSTAISMCNCFRRSAMHFSLL